MLKACKIPASRMSIYHLYGIDTEIANRVWIVVAQDNNNTVSAITRYMINLQLWNQDADY